MLPLNVVAKGRHDGLGGSGKQFPVSGIGEVQAFIPSSGSDANQRPPRLKWRDRCSPPVR